MRRFFLWIFLTIVGGTGLYINSSIFCRVSPKEFLHGPWRLSFEITIYTRYLIWPLSRTPVVSHEKSDAASSRSMCEDLHPLGSKSLVEVLWLVYVNDLHLFTILDPWWYFPLKMVGEMLELDTKERWSPCSFPMVCKVIIDGHESDRTWYFSFRDLAVGSIIFRCRSV